MIQIKILFKIYQKNKKIREIMRCEDSMIHLNLKLKEARKRYLNGKKINYSL